MRLLLIAASFLFFSNSHAADPIHTECNLPADQGRGSLFGSWASLPITLVFDSEFYTVDDGVDARAMERAAGAGVFVLA